MKRRYINTKTAPSFQLIFSLERKYHRKRLVITENMTKLEKVGTISTLKDEAINGIPKIHVVFMKQVPTIFPNARSKCPFSTAPTLTTNTGKLVPKATTVEPIIMGDMPVLLAMLEAELMIKKELITTPAAPKNVNSMY
jgi:hypothetical protein